MSKRPSQKSAKNACDRLFSQYVRSLGYCERCGRSGVRLETSHWISRRFSNTRCDPDNAFCLCSACHRWWHNFPTDSGRWAIEQRGEAVYERLREAANEPAKVDWVAEREVLKRMVDSVEIT